MPSSPLSTQRHMYLPTGRAMPMVCLKLHHSLFFLEAVPGLRSNSAAKHPRGPCNPHCGLAGNQSYDILMTLNDRHQPEVDRNCNLQTLKPSPLDVNHAASETQQQPYIADTHSPPYRLSTYIAQQSTGALDDAALTTLSRRFTVANGGRERVYAQFGA